MSICRRMPCLAGVGHADRPYCKIGCNHQPHARDPDSLDQVVLRPMRRLDGWITPCLDAIGRCERPRIGASATSRCILRCPSGKSLLPAIK